MTEQDESSVLTAKIITSLSLFVLSTIFGLLPYKLMKVLKLDQKKTCREEPAVVVSVLLFFGGGVLLATTFLHLLPEVRDTIHSLSHLEVVRNFKLSLAEFLVVFGFLLMFFAEEVVQKFMMESEKDSTSISAGVSTTTINSNLSHGSHHHISNVSSLRGLMIVFALSIHELFEGFAVGLLMEASGVYLMLAALSLHKFIIAFCIGCELIIQRTEKKFAVAFVVIYSAVTGIGE
jgi:solute carrier family 39 (zinc transporter), member 1/2/3